MKYTIICSLLVSSSAHVLRTQTKPCTLIKYWGNVAKDCTDGKITGDLCTFANNCASGDATTTTPTEPTEPSEAGCELVCAKDTCIGTQHHESLIHHIQHSNPIPYKEKWTLREANKTPKGCCGFFSWDKTCDLCCPPEKKEIVELGDMCQCTGNGNEISCSITKQRHCASDEDCTGKEQVKFGDWSSICVKKEKETTASGSRCAGKKKCDPCGATGNKQCWPFAGAKEQRTAPNGKDYTHQEFVDYFASEQGKSESQIGGEKEWEKAPEVVRCLLKGEGGMDCPAEEDPVKDVIEDEPITPTIETEDKNDCASCFETNNFFCKDGAGYCVSMQDGRAECKNDATMIKKVVGCSSGVVPPPVNPSPIDCKERKKITGKMKFKSKHNMEVWCNCNAKSFEIASADRCGEIEKAAHCTWDEGTALCAPKASTQ